MTKTEQLIASQVFREVKSNVLFAFTKYGDNYLEKGVYLVNEQIHLDMRELSSLWRFQVQMNGKHLQEGRSAVKSGKAELQPCLKIDSKTLLS